jgi:hypothetical protein
MKPKTSNQDEQSSQDKTKRKFLKRLHVVVTQKEIDQAKRAKSDGCMIQDSLKRMRPGFQKIWVDKNQVRFTDPAANVIYTFQMAPMGRVMILKWDAGEEIEPFDIWLRNPIVRERQLVRGHMRPKPSEDSVGEHLGPVPQPKTKEARKQTGRDRVFGQKLWTDELASLRRSLEVRDKKGGSPHV